jgi:RNA polymerase sigma factor (sigma-70 family)
LQQKHSHNMKVATTSIHCNRSVKIRVETHPPADDLDNIITGPPIDDHDRPVSDTAGAIPDLDEREATCLAEEDESEQSDLDETAKACPRVSISVFSEQSVLIPRKQGYLSPAEERELIARYQKDGDPDAARKLCEAFERLIKKTLKSYHSPGLDYDDKLSDGKVGLLTAVKRFDHTKGKSLGSYARWWMRNEIGRAALKFSTVVGRPSWEEGGADTSLNVEAEFEDGDGIETEVNQITDTGEAAPVSTDEDEEYGNHLATAFRRVNLSARDRRIFEARYLVANPLTLAELSTELGITGERVRVLARRTERLVLDAAKRLVNLRPDNFPQTLTYSVFRYRTDESAWRGTGPTRSVLLERTRPDWSHTPMSASENRARQPAWDLLPYTKGETKFRRPLPGWNQMYLSPEGNRIRAGGQPREERIDRARRDSAVSHTPRLALIAAGRMKPRWMD